MTPQERAVIFECEGKRLVGISALPAQPSTLGVLIVVGGPQYRAGSHRQFVHLARALARGGYPTFRFDYRGMGDSEGATRDFEQIEPDIHAAVRAFRGACPGVRQMVTFGLCDAASAILMAAGRIDGLAGMILANPWVRRAETLNAAVVRHYYRERLFSAEFWQKFASGNLPLRSVAGEFIRRVSSLLTAGVRKTDEAPVDFIDRMRAGWRLPVKKLLLLSGRDLTAQEFEETRGNDSRWAVDSDVVELRFPEADHTFSTARWRDDAASACIHFLEQLSRAA